MALSHGLWHKLRQNDNGVENMSGLNNYLLLDSMTIYSSYSWHFYRRTVPCSVLWWYFCCSGNNTAKIHQSYSRASSTKHVDGIPLAVHWKCFLGSSGALQIICSSTLPSSFQPRSESAENEYGFFLYLEFFHCTDGTRCRFFGHVPPTLEDYLPLDEVLEPHPAVNLGTVWDYGGTPLESWFTIQIWHGIMVEDFLLRVYFSL